MEQIILKKLVEEPGNYDHQQKCDNPVVLQIQIPKPGVKKPQVMGESKKISKKKSLVLFRRAKHNPDYLKEVASLNDYKANLNRQATSVRKFMI
jgi:hypothetical protein